MNWEFRLYVSVYCGVCSGREKKKKKHKQRPCKGQRRRGKETITETEFFLLFCYCSTWGVRSCVVCEGPILSLTAESCVYYRWNNLSNNDTTSGILGRCANVWLQSLSPSLSCFFNVCMCSIYVYVLKICVCMCVLANMHIMCTHVPLVVTKKHFQPNKVCF